MKVRVETTALRKVFAILSMLLISGVLAKRSLGKAVPKIEVVELVQPSSADQDATFEKVWVEHSVRVEGKKGMRIHAKFKVKNSLNVSCTLIAQFYKRDGAYLKAGGDPAYTTSEGHVYAYVNFTPRFISTAYADKSLFIPYEAFNLKEGGQYSLKFVLFLDRKSPGNDVQTIGHSADFNFKYTKEARQ